MGREFEGEAFKPTPAVVLFKDFEVGQTYKQVITLTNTSLARNAFKVSPCSHHPSHQKKGKEKTTPFGVNLMRSQVLYWAAHQDLSHHVLHKTG